LHPALQCLRTTWAGVRSVLALGMSPTSRSSRRRHLPPFALYAALPRSLAGRPSGDYYGGSVTLELAPRRPSRVLSVVDVLARRRCLVRPLEWGHSPPPTLRRVRAPDYLTPYPGGPATDAVAGDVALHHWRLSFRQCGLHHIARVLRDAGISVFCLLPLSQHAPFPLGFRRRVGWVTQKPSSSELLLSLRGINDWMKRRTNPG